MSVVELESKNTPQDPNVFASLVGVTLGQVRKSFSPQVYEHSRAQTYGWFAFDVAAYVLMMIGLFSFSNPFARIGFGLLAGIATANMFVWAHDAAHGALFGEKKRAEILGTIAMLPSLNMYRLWCYGHNKVHHGFTSFTPIDWIWRPHTREEYASSSKWSKLVYRVERSFLGCGLHYLLRVWWPGMVTFNPDSGIAKSNHFLRSRLVTALFIVVMSWISYDAAGVLGVFAAVVIPFVVFTYTIALFVYLHHTHPTRPFYDERKEWNATFGQVGCSTIIRMSKISEALTHNIMVHTPHHVDMRIPFYRLKQAYADMKPEFGECILEYRWSWGSIRHTFKSCKLYDYRTHTWSKFDEVRV